MLKIIVELHPFGNSDQKRTIASMDLWNDGSGDRFTGNYEGRSIVEPSPWNENPEVRGGKVVGHARSLSIWSLVAKMLKACGYEAEAMDRNNKKFVRTNHHGGREDANLGSKQEQRDTVAAPAGLYTES